MSLAQGIFFYAFLAIFVVTALVAILGIIGWVRIPPRYLNPLFGGLLLEIVAVTIGLYRATDWFGPKPIPIPDFSGQWSYVCKSHYKERPDYEHGGICTFEIGRSPYGIQLRISGERQWIQDGSTRTENMKMFWNSTWCVMTAHNQLMFEYVVPTGPVNGFSRCNILLDEAGKPKQLTGHFYQLPPLTPLYGSLDFTRTSKAAETRPDDH